MGSSGIGWSGKTANLQQIGSRFRVGSENPSLNSGTCASGPEHNRLFERPCQVLRAGEAADDDRRHVAAPYGDMAHNWPFGAIKRTGDTESGWRPLPDKNSKLVPHWGEVNR